MKEPMQKFYKIISMHQFWSHETYKPKQLLPKIWLLKLKMQLNAFLSQVLPKISKQ